MKECIDAGRHGVVPHNLKMVMYNFSCKVQPGGISGWHVQPLPARVRAATRGW